VRHSLNFCGWKDRKNVAKDLKRIYQAVDDEDAAKALDDFEAEWGRKYPSIAPSWRRAWQEVNPFFAFPPAVRKITYTTNAIESLNRVIRKTTKTRGSFPTPSRACKHALPGSGRGRDKADLLGDPQLRESRQMRQRMGCRAKPVRYSISRTVQ
jgi:transposase-like protein